MNFWYREAQKRLIQDQIKAIQAARYAMAEGDSYKEVINGLQSQFNAIDIGRDRIAKDNWSELKKTRRR